jgi:aminoglycoside/choline kinase family phosphotransferase
VQQRLLAAGVNVPEILELDLDSGFILLTDLGRTLYLTVLNEINADELYDDALMALLAIQRQADSAGMPPYDSRLLLDEMGLFRDWLVGRHLQIRLSGSQSEDLNRVYSILEENALDQPVVFVHRDYHSRNLMISENHNPGVLDFQDAVVGPVTYDLVSLLKDCYIKWPEHRVRGWALKFYESIDTGGMDQATFLRRFDLMGVQRHLKASGIFARLYHRDHKDRYLQDIPRTLSYILDLEQRYPELGFLCALIRTEVIPALGEARCAP